MQWCWLLLIKFKKNETLPCNKMTFANFLLKLDWQSCVERSTHKFEGKQDESNSMEK